MLHTQSLLKIFPSYLMLTHKKYQDMEAKLFIYSTLLRGSCPTSALFGITTEFLGNRIAASRTSASSDLQFGI